MTLKEIYEDAASSALSMGISEGLVFGEGNAESEIMLIGEAPGAEEVKLSRPFAGKAGRNLDEFLGVLEIQREDIYITNVVKFRPYKTGKTGRLSNRPPSTAEIECMLPHLMREIAAVSPKLVVTLGNVPLKSVLGDRKAVIGGLHSQPLPACALTHEFTLFPLYHPASIIYNRELRSVYLNDLNKLRQYIFSLNCMSAVPTR